MHGCLCLALQDSEAAPQASEQEPAAAAGAGGARKQRRSQRQLLAAPATAPAVAAAPDTIAEAPLLDQPLQQAQQQESGRRSRGGSTAYTVCGAAVSQQQLLLPQQHQHQHPSPAGTSDSLASCDVPMQQECQQQCRLKPLPQPQQCQQKAQLLCPGTEPQPAACRLKGVPLLYHQQCQQYEQQCMQQFQEHQQEYQKARGQAYCTQGAPQQEVPQQLHSKRVCPQLLQPRSQQQAQPQQQPKQTEAMEFDQLLLHSAFLNFATECDPDGAADEELQAIGSPDDLQHLMAPGEQQQAQAQRQAQQRQAQQQQAQQQPVAAEPAAASVGAQEQQGSKKLLPPDAPLLAVLQQVAQITRREAGTAGAAVPVQQALAAPAAPAAEQQPGAAAVLSALAAVFSEQVAAAHATSAAATASVPGTAAPSPMPVAASPLLSTDAGSAQQSLTMYAAASLTGSPAGWSGAHPAEEKQQELATPLDDAMLMDLLAVDAALNGVSCYEACRAPGGSGSRQRNKRKHGSSSSGCSSGQLGAVHSDDAGDSVPQLAKMGRAVSSTSQQCSRGSSLIAVVSPMDSQQSYQQLQAQQLSDGQATAATASPECLHAPQQAALPWQQQVSGPGQAAAAAMAAGAGNAHSLPPSVRAQLPPDADERTMQLHLAAFAEAMAIVKASAPFPAPMPGHHSPALATSEGSAGPSTGSHHMAWQAGPHTFATDPLPVGGGGGAAAAAAAAAGGSIPAAGSPTAAAAAAAAAMAPGYAGMPGVGMQAGQLHAAQQQLASRYNSSGLLTSLSIKMYNCLPHELPASLRLELLQALGGGLLSEGFIRQGCLLLTYDVVMAKGAGGGCCCCAPVGMRCCLGAGMLHGDLLTRSLHRPCTTCMFDQ
jgi:hypothetical protein